MLNLHYVVTNHMHNEEVVYEFDQVPCWGLIVLNTPALVEVHGMLQRIPENSAVVYAPGQRCLVKALDGKYCDDWIRFDCDDVFPGENFIPSGVPFFLPDRYFIYDMFHLIAIENLSKADSREYCITQLMHVLFHKLYDDYNKGSSEQAFPEYMRLRDEIYLHPEYDWGIPMMLEQLHVSSGTLHTTYQRLFGITCMNDVIESRLNHAMHLLTYTRMQITEIAFDCGYKNVEHFSRQFRQRQGLSPIQYRKSMRTTLDNDTALI